VKKTLLKGLHNHTVEQTILKTIDHAAVNRWEPARERALQTQGTTPERVHQITQHFTKELSAVGAASGGLAALPGVGTVSAMMATAADVAWTTTRACDIVMTVGAIHGHDLASPLERQTWIMSVLGHGDRAYDELTRVHELIAAGGHEDLSRLSGGSLAALNQGFIRNLITDWTMRRLAAAVGRALPFGIGAVVGGLSNRASARTVARHADAMFARLAAARAVEAPAPLALTKG
jgi:hypothetical protein